MSPLLEEECKVSGERGKKVTIVCHVSDCWQEEKQTYLDLGASGSCDMDIYCKRVCTGRKLHRNGLS